MPRAELTKDTYDIVKKAAAKRGVSIVSLVNKVLAASLSDGQMVVLNVPKELTKNNFAGLHDWLGERVNYLLKHFYPKVKTDGINTSTS